MNISTKLPNQKNKGRREMHSAGRAVSMCETLETRVLYSVAVAHPVVVSFPQQVGSHLIPRHHGQGQATT